MGSNGSTPPFGTLLALRRLLRHRWAEAASRRALSPQVLHRLGSHVSASERLHTGQIRVIAEASLPWSYLRRHASPRERAIMLFSKYRVWDTEHNNGVLIYLLLADRDVEVVADRGIHAKVGSQEWEKICRKMETAFKQANYEGGVVSGIQAVTQHLVKHFPASGAGQNELPDKPVVL